MLKKIGIVAATVTAATAIAAPFAFAGDKSHHAHVTHEGPKYSYEVDNSVDRDQYNRCNFEQNSTDRGDALLGALPLLGTQTQTLNCTNVGDVSAVTVGGNPGTSVVAVPAS